jgi:hypothetical protein
MAIIGLAYVSNDNGQTWHPFNPAGALVAAAEETETPPPPDSLTERIAQTLRLKQPRHKHRKSRDE